MFTEWRLGLSGDRCAITSDYTADGASIHQLFVLGDRISTNRNCPKSNRAQ